MRNRRKSSTFVCRCFTVCDVMCPLSGPLLCDQHFAEKFKEMKRVDSINHIGLKNQSISDINDQVEFVTFKLILSPFTFHRPSRPRKQSWRRRPSLGRVTNSFFLINKSEVKRLPCHTANKNIKGKAKSVPKSIVNAFGENKKKREKKKQQNYHRISHGRFAPKMGKEWNMCTIVKASLASFGSLDNRWNSTHFHIGPIFKTIDALISLLQLAKLSSRLPFKIHFEPNLDLVHKVSLFQLRY